MTNQPADLCEECGHDYHWHFEYDNLPSGRTGCGQTICPCKAYRPKPTAAEGEIQLLKPLVVDKGDGDLPTIEGIEWVPAKGEIVQEIAVAKNGDVIVLGTPFDGEESGLPEDEWHNCDAMGCGQCHVLWRYEYPTLNATSAVGELVEAATRYVENEGTSLKDLLRKRLIAALANVKGTTQG